MIAATQEETVVQTFWTDTGTGLIGRVCGIPVTLLPGRSPGVWIAQLDAAFGFQAPNLPRASQLALVHLAANLEAMAAELRGHIS